MISVAYAGPTEHNNSKGLLFKLTFSGDYGANGVGDICDLTPSNVSDPNFNYDQPLCFPPKNVGVFSTQLGGSYVQLKPNANPALNNLGVQMFEPGGAEKATNAAYTAAELAGSVTIFVELPLQ